MIFTNSDLKKIKDFITQESVKDSSFQNIILNDNNISNIYIPVIIQNGNKWENKRISLKDLINFNNHILTINEIFENYNKLWNKIYNLEICDNENYNFIITKVNSNFHLRNVIIKQSFIYMSNNLNTKIVNQVIYEMTEHPVTLNGKNIYRAKQYRRQLKITKSNNTSTVTILNGPVEIISEDIKTINNNSLIGVDNITI